MEFAIVRTARGITFGHQPYPMAVVINETKIVVGARWEVPENVVEWTWSDGAKWQMRYQTLYKGVATMARDDEIVYEKPGTSSDRWLVTWYSRAELMRPSLSIRCGWCPLPVRVVSGQSTVGTIVRSGSGVRVRCRRKWPFVAPAMVGIWASSVIDYGSSTNA